MKPKPHKIGSMPNGPTAPDPPRPRSKREDGSVAIMLESYIASHKILRLGAVALLSVLNCVIVSSLASSGKDASVPCLIVEAIYGFGFIALMSLDDAYWYGPRVNKLVNYWQHIATRDSLTGLYNRLAFLQALDKRIAIAEDTRARYGVMFIDLNKFKEINDTFGHAIGDGVLTITARRILSVVGSDDMVARLGGDEFAVLLMRTNVVLARKFEVELETIFRQPMNINGQILRVGASIGTCLASDHHKFAEDVIHSADILMYRQKALNRWSGNTRVNQGRTHGVKRLGNELS